ncbi:MULTISPECIES: hypothetical protein [unclassified Microcoleus]|uniref:hypothetical protein n=1 Tax=unclassified Microcoleus TaxID=2642155 RepID=UPI002FD29750
MFIQELVPCRSQARQGCVPISPEGCDTKIRGYDRTYNSFFKPIARLHDRSGGLYKSENARLFNQMGRSTQRKLYGRCAIVRGV